MSLIVKLEIHPGGDASRAVKIGEARIHNISELAELSDYEFTLSSSLDRTTPRYYAGEIQQHKRSRGAWALVHKLLNQMFESGYFKL